MTENANLPNVPHLEQEGRQAFIHRIRMAETYLEYGSGNSTLLAADLGVKVFATYSLNVE